MAAVREVNGYKIEGNWSRVAAGRSQHAVGYKAGKRYFIKRFMEPKYPLSGSVETQRRLILECEAFEARTRQIIDAVKGSTGEGGNLVAPIDFFRHESTYYKVFHWIDPGLFDFAHIFDKNIAEKYTFCISMLNAVHVLHSHDFVHGDLKPTNIIVYKLSSGNLGPKVIDFDDGYFASSPPLSPETLIGTPEYYAPEVFNFISTEDASFRAMISPKTDIFSMGLLLWHVFSGSYHVNAECKDLSVGGFVAQRGGLGPLQGVEDTSVDALIRAMLRSEVEMRPTARQVSTSLRRISQRKPDDFVRSLSGADTETTSIVKRAKRPALSSLKPIIEVSPILTPEVPGTTVKTKSRLFTPEVKIALVRSSDAIVRIGKKTVTALETRLVKIRNRLLDKIKD